MDLRSVSVACQAEEDGQIVYRTRAPSLGPSHLHQSSMDASSSSSPWWLAPQLEGLEPSHPRKPEPRSFEIRRGAVNFDIVLILANIL